MVGYFEGFLYPITYDTLCLGCFMPDLMFEAIWGFLYPIINGDLYLDGFMFY